MSNFTFNSEALEYVSSYNSSNSDADSVDSIDSIDSIDELIQNYLSIENFMTHVSIKNNKSKSYGHSHSLDSNHSKRKQVSKMTNKMTNNMKIKNLVVNYNNLIESQFSPAGTAYIYARTSTKQQEGMVSIDVQCTELLKLCFDNKFKIEGIYIDDGKSAKTNKKLSSLALLKKNVQSKEHVYIYDVSRLSRNSREGIDMLDTLSERDVNIFFKTEGINYKGAYNKNTIRKALSDSQYLSESITEKVNNAIKIKRQLGHHIGGIPYGYSRQNNVLVINKKEHDVMKYANKVYNKFNLKSLTAHKRCLNILTNVNKKYPTGFRGKQFTMRNIKLCITRLSSIAQQVAI